MGEEKINPGLAAVFSFVFNGLGQLYNGQITKGMAIIFSSASSIMIFIAGSILIASWLLGKVIFAGQIIWGLALFGIGLLFICILGAYSIFDAYRVALKK